MIRNVFILLQLSFFLTMPSRAAPDAVVSPVPQPVGDRFKLAPFYQKYLDLDGVPILSSAKVSDPALREAAWIIRHMLAAHPEIIRTLGKNGVRVVVMAHDEYTTDVPEQSGMTPKAFWDRRARGLGGDISSCGEENLLCFPGDPYSTENLLIHEFSHTIHNYGLETLIPDFDKQLQQAYENALKTGLWKGTYAGTNRAEYWAEAAQSWFDNNRENDDLHNSVDTRKELKEYDPQVAELCSKVFGDEPWRYKKPMDRPQEQREHLAGYDSSKAPAFKWPTVKGTEENPAPAVAPVTGLRAQPLPASDVRLTGGPLKHAQDLDAAYLLSLEPDRMLYYLRKRVGLPQKAGQGYGGWDGGGRQLTGHIAGHYLSAVSFMYAATGDKRFKERADYIVAELREIQSQDADGYIGALMASTRSDKERFVDGKLRFDDLSKGVIESSGFDLNGMWAPWYVQHKIYAGLRDAYRLTGNKTALDVELKFAHWAEGILLKLDDAQTQKMLGTEFGGMNEVMVDLYADTGDRRWLDLSDRFEHRAVLDPLKKGEDKLAGLHGNTQIPKIIGSLERYIYTGRKEDKNAADFFWDRVVNHHSYATGGHGKDEYFGESDKLGERVDGRTAETCNVYNMLKLTRTLFSLKPDPKYAEFEERALFNHILASMDDKDGRTCYMVPVGRGVTHEYQDMHESFTCCVGTGMESHALHGRGIYYQMGSKLWVNLYAPSTAEWKEMGVKLDTRTDFPEGESVTIRLSMEEANNFTLALRRPSWARESFALTINGREISDVSTAGTYVELAREWKNGDLIEMKMPKTLWTQPVPDNPNRVALMWGPLVLAGDLGEEDVQGAAVSVPVFLTNHRDISSWLKPVADQPGTFRTQGVGRERDVDFTPFYRLHRRTYGIYWDLFAQSEWDLQAAQIAAERERQKNLESATVAYAQPGEMQPERDFNFRGEDAEPRRVMGRAYRRSSKWFSFDLPIDPSHPAAIVVTYNQDEWRKRTFEIFADDQRIGEQTIERGGAPRFFDAEYAIPAGLLTGKKKITIRFQPTYGNETAGIFGIRMIRADAKR